MKNEATLAGNRHHHGNFRALAPLRGRRANRAIAAIGQRPEELSPERSPAPKGPDDIRLASAYEASARGGLPDLSVRTGQAWRTFLSYPQGIDGAMGRMTRAALNAFQVDNKMTPTLFFDDETLAALRAAAS